MSVDDEMRSYALVYAAGLAITDVISAFADHYSLSPEEPWTPKSNDTASIGSEVDRILVELEKATINARSLLRAAFD